jgi:hypothetical protein
MSATFILSVWIVLGAATLVLAIYRRILATHQEEDVIHLAPGEEGEIAKQTSLAHRLTAIDHWGIAMTVITAIIGIGLASAYLYQAWESPNPGPNNFDRMNSPAK